MLDRPQNDPAARITTLVRGFFAKRSIDWPVGHDDDLCASGLSSLNIVAADLVGVGHVDAPFALRADQMSVVATRSALTDAGVAWLFETVQRAMSPGVKARPKQR